MRTTFGAFAALLVLSTVGCAQDRDPENKRDRNPRRLESVTWNSIKHELTWVISRGEKGGEGGYKPLSTSTYVINMDKATMSFNGETRGFSKEEAVNVRALMDLVAKYAIESTIWWDQGHGQRQDKLPRGTRVAHQPEAGSDLSHSPTLQDLLLRLEEDQARRTRPALIKWR